MINHLIQQIENFIVLNSEEKNTVRSLFKEKAYKKGTFFLKEGQVCKQVGFVTKGVFRYYINHDGEDKTYDFAQENFFTCNYESFIPQVPSNKNIQALEDCEILQISYDDLQAFYQSVKGAERFGRLIIEQVFIQTLQDLSSFYTDSPELRYEKFLKKHPALLQRISQYHIASYVGVKPQSLSRIRKRIFAEK
ncbi:Crp/Fnr family transcriptional regulator [Mucilaginibacter lacusdianchii]|uniref:Crp/Fnr family transcriptional regulator n=1 Tax=Mucilaginibacter lacusdianchii TaxID=2684211 RepID=UPI00131E00F5|nr:Crp/Fnr family transcriptional regulator [Mucilaginibacter sp. JXJ CY 39]